MEIVPDPIVSENVSPRRGADPATRLDGPSTPADMVSAAIEVTWGSEIDRGRARRWRGTFRTGAARREVALG